MSLPVSQVRSRVPRLAEAAVERARLTVVPRRAQTAPRVPFVSLVSLLLVTGVVGLLLFNTNMQQASFVAGSMEEQAAALTAKEESLRMQLHRLRDPQHLASKAQRLGMVPAETPAFIRLADGTVLGRPTAARPDDLLRIAPLPPVKPKVLRPDPVIAELPDPTKKQRAAVRDVSARTEARSRLLRAQARADRRGAAAGVDPAPRRSP